MPECGCKDSEIVIPRGDWNGHVGLGGNGFEDVHGGYGFGNVMWKAKKLLEFALANDLVVGKTCFITRGPGTLDSSPKCCHMSR